MNCMECRDSLVAYVERLLGNSDRVACESHLTACAACRGEMEAIVALHRRLTADTVAPAGASLTQAVMNRILVVQRLSNRRSTMIKSFIKWGSGIAGLAAAAAVVFAMLFWSSPTSQATAAEVMTKGAQAVSELGGIHMKARLRTAPADNFSQIDAKRDLVPIEIWKEFDGDKQWRIEKPGRVVVMDGQSTVMLIKPHKLAVKVPQATRGAFDSGWLVGMADVAANITSEFKAAQSHGWNLTMANEKGPDGAAKQVVTVEAKSGLPEGDYLRNKFFGDSDTRRVYRFDAKSGRLEDIKVYLHAQGGDVLIFEVEQIEYNPTFDPSVFTLELPKDVVWYKEPQKLVGSENDKYSKMTAEQAAQAFFEACAKEDWKEVEKFFPNLPQEGKNHVSGLRVLRIGESFTSEGYPGRFVPYEIKLRDGTVQKGNLAMKKLEADRWIVDGGLGL